MKKTPWIGVDLDGTLAHYDQWRGPLHIGKPIAKMVIKVKQTLSEGKTVKIFTARADDPAAVVKIREWLHREARLPPLEVTNKKDFACVEIWDDRARQVKKNMGIFVDAK